MRSSTCQSINVEDTRQTNATYILIQAETKKEDTSTINDICNNLREVLGTGGDDEELLEGKLVAGVLTTVDDVEAGDGESVRGGVAGNVGVVLPEGNALSGGAGLGRSEGDCTRRRREEERTTVN